MLKNVVANNLPSFRSDRAANEKQDTPDPSFATIPNQSGLAPQSQSQQQSQVQSRAALQRIMSSGRGGAGNINTQPNAGQHEAPDLSTPTIKAATYTTGRGGQGNMVANDASKPEIARIAQNTEAPLHHYKELSGTHHWGRGGEGNMMTVGKNPATANLARPDGPQKRTSSFTGALEGVREALGFGKRNTTAEKKEKEKEKEKNGSDSAVADD